MRFDGQRALIPASLGILFVLRFGFGAPIWVLALCMLWIPIYYIGMPMLAMRRWPSFAREFAYRFQQTNFKTDFFSVLSFIFQVGIAHRILISKSRYTVKRENIFPKATIKY